MDVVLNWISIMSRNDGFSEYSRPAAVASVGCRQCSISFYQNVCEQVGVKCPLSCEDVGGYFSDLFKRIIWELNFIRNPGF